MNEQKNTKVNVGEELKWNKFTEHREVFNQELLSATEADELGVSVSSVLRERIEVGGIVLPHYHDVAEVIHITKGKVRLLKNGEWTSYKEGDTFLVPKGVVHSVANDDTEPTEQVSIFLPVSDDVENEGFKSHMVDVEA
ncbi:cupin domain-containing protein [Virgibacillus halodenitrificans]|uniref:Cupin n=1 Tax=Virgibacillus halodenitrificans TaxID=1482 RepID=A0AAC9J135_VIRHA|nr:cupin domain-containing protein [Virgibacillus halodenitrificans]APC49441.1 cupin [Virgibacillus halodenitrificans]MCG1027264.1 cupin domain-containing protein [Virgibacillus halodenitrificans]CDQ31191.1 Cupin domain protein [Virgibacillus halodenitrificans]